ncbi:sensor histidine kinase [Lutimonas sp.]|uniref:sensor histidine kinase n=1 Tax=Lutimonas sp. TaxID=1872403 RepID=UPI003D9BCE04
MNKIRLNPQIGLMLIIFLLIFYACKEEKKAPPFPENESEYLQPLKKTFEISDVDTLGFSSKKLPSPSTWPSRRINFNNLASKPFDVVSSQSLGTFPAKTLNWDDLPQTDLVMDSLPTIDFDVKVSVLGQPKMIKTGFYEVAERASKGVMTLGEGFGYPGTIEVQIIDSQGAVWLAGNGGLARYDGINLELYSQEQGLTSNPLVLVKEDAKNRIWVVDNRGSLMGIDLDARLIFQLMIPDVKNGYNDFSFDSNGRIWASNVRLGYDIIDFDTKSLQRITPEHGLLDTDLLIEAYEDSEGLIWLTTAKGINIIDKQAGKNFTFTSKDGLLDDFVVKFREDSQKRIWIGTKGGLTILDPSKEKIHYFNEPFEMKGQNAVSDIYEGANGVFWIGTDNGLLYKYDESNSTLDKIKIREKNTFVGVWGLIEDSQGQLWVPTLREGVFLYDPKGANPGNFTMEDGLSGNEYWSTIQTKDGKTWMGGLNGIDIYDPVKGELKHLSKKNGLSNDRSNRLLQDSKGRVWSFGLRSGVDLIDVKNNTIKQFTNNPEIFDSSWIVSMLEDNNGNYWMGGNNGDLFFIDLKNNVINKYVIDSIGDANLIDNIIEDDQQRIWLAGRGIGIHILDPSNNKRMKIGATNGLISDNVYSLFQGGPGIFWIATDLGVERLNLETNNLLSFSMSQGLASNDVYALIKRKNKMILGTSKGLTMLESTGNADSSEAFWKVNTLAKNQGLSYLDFNMNSFSLDKEDRLWAGVESQVITVVDTFKSDDTTVLPELTGIQIYDKKQDFYDIELIESRLKSIDTVWAWESNISVVKDKNDLISSYKTQNKIEWDTVEGAYKIPKGLKLPYNQNYLSFSYGALQFKNQDKIVYRYILEGYDDKWNDITNKTISKNYRDLPEGNYTFKVAAKGINEVWSEPSEFDFSVMPRLLWWQTWWAILIFAVLFLLLGIAILNYRSRWLKKENRILEEKVNERTQELNKTINELKGTQSQLIQSEKMASLGELTAGIAHEIQNPMNFINNFSEVTIELIDEMNEELEKGDLGEAKDISKDIVQNLEKITHHGKRASSIVKGMLEHSRNSSGKKEFVDLNVLSDEYLRLAYHGLRAKDKSFNADFQTDFDETLPKVEIIPQDIGRVVLNIINNAFFAVTSIPEKDQVEGFKPQVTVSTKKLKNQARISIKDNGPGIPQEIKDKIFQPFFTTKPTGKGTGLGLSLAYDIVTTGHGGAIELNTEPGKGTEFVIYIPIKK